MVHSGKRRNPGGGTDYCFTHLAACFTNCAGVIFMSQYIIKRLLILPFLLIIFSIFAFIIIQAPPGDFITTYIADLAASGSAVDQAPRQGR